MAKESKGRQPTPELEEILSEHLCWLRGGQGRQISATGKTFNKQVLPDTTCAKPFSERPTYRENHDLRLIPMSREDLSGLDLSKKKNQERKSANLRGLICRGLTSIKQISRGRTCKAPTWKAPI